MRKAVVVDDDVLFCSMLKQSLRKDRFEVTVFGSYREALGYLDNGGSAEVFILDYDLGEEKNGYDLCVNIRKQGNAAIVMLTGDASTKTLVRCLDAGADQYVTKPFNSMELLARVNAAIRSKTKPQSDEFDDRKTVGELEVDSKRRLLKMEGRELQLSQKEAELAVLLIVSQGQEYSREKIYSMIYGGDMNIFSRKIDVLVGRLRKKIQHITNGKYSILHTRGYGYFLVDNRK